MRTAFFTENVSDPAAVVHMFPVTTDSTAPRSMLLPNAVIILSVPKNIKTEEDLKDKLPHEINENVDWLYLVKEKHSALLWFKGRYTYFVFQCFVRRVFHYIFFIYKKKTRIM